MIFSSVSPHLAEQEEFPLKVFPFFTRASFSKECRCVHAAALVTKGKKTGKDLRFSFPSSALSRASAVCVSFPLFAFARFLLLASALAPLFLLASPVVARRSLRRQFSRGSLSFFETSSSFPFSFFVRFLLFFSSFRVVLFALPLSLLRSLLVSFSFFYTFPFVPSCPHPSSPPPLPPSVPQSNLFSSPFLPPFHPCPLPLLPTFIPSSLPSSFFVPPCPLPHAPRGMRERTCAPAARSLCGVRTRFLASVSRARQVRGRRGSEGVDGGE